MSNSKLRAFLTVARHGSFSAGARALGLSQPTITTQVQALERQHNLELFHRRGRRAELSAVGRQLLPIAQQLVALETEAEGLLRDSGTLMRGQLRLGAVGPFHVIEMVDAYARAYPQIELSIRVGNSASVLADLENYVTDVGVLAGLHHDPAFHATLYARHPVIVFAHRDHPLARRDSVRLEELQGQRMLQREQGSTTRLAFEKALAEREVTPRMLMEIGSREALREAVVRGIGLGVVSEAEYVPGEDIRAIRIEGDPVHTETYLYCLSERRTSQLVETFLACADQARLRR
ncbi:LysR substrate-binding domain-containing protein [Pseudomonas alkylphenolica]|uniref:LysR substrate-binding domain-containing protein n=1 Tax=Pseudomonas alkylphenolica TaxID=237609 RepID=UPI0018D79EFB|nr:LysR substrate-binding domain-containing protein [Pseudomonas alkylphenolica]MBH3427146.1 LysR family transcriptional regulator [Pseudomonas alkylphenolica]